jgi:BirA family biotin operon repressor/biotin-[acetyl-CoA-carboxylase] ligase
VSWLGLQRIALDVCESTNDEAARRARTGAINGTVVTATAQRAGRGRLGRSWHSPPGENLYLSCILRPRLQAAQVPPLTLAAGIAVRDAVNSLGPAAFLKWPNDVVVLGRDGRPRKLAGILTEMSAQGQQIEHVILGVGVNLETRDFPPPLAEVATSVRLACPERGPVDQAAFLDLLLVRLASWIDRYVASGLGAIRDEWMARTRCDLEVELEHRGQRLGGRMVGLGAAGELLVEIAGRGQIAVTAGDVVYAGMARPERGES